MTTINPDKIAAYIREVAFDKIMPRFQKLADHEISTKSGPTDFVTIADLEAEIDLTRTLLDVIPGSYVLGEEAVSKNETDIRLLGQHDGYVWVIDPVDGTGNFASGDKKFGTIVALSYKGEIINGWILDIPENRMGVAERGSGVLLNGNAVQYQPSKKPLKDTRGFISVKFLPPKMRDDLKDVLANEFGEVKPYMCCAHEYLAILEAQSYFALYSRIRPWDHQAGALMMREAGGITRKWDGSDYTVADQRGGLIVAANDDAWNEIHSHVIAQYVGYYN